MTLSGRGAARRREVMGAGMVAQSAATPTVEDRRLDWADEGRIMRSSSWRRLGAGGGGHRTPMG